MLGRTTRGDAPSSSKQAARPAEESAGGVVTNAAAAAAAVAGGNTAILGATPHGGREVTISQFVAQLDEAARRRLDSMHQRLRLLEQQMETLEAEVGKASSNSPPPDDTTYA